MTAITTRRDARTGIMVYTGKTKAGMTARIQHNEWGNWRGYLSGREVVFFTNGLERTAEQEAHAWLARVTA